MAFSMNDFVHLGAQTSLYTPKQPASGQLIVLCTWLGAARKHIVKYTSLYQRIAPSARILLIKSEVPILNSSYAIQRKAIRPAVSVILDILAECGYPTLPSERASSEEHIASEDNIVSGQGSIASAGSAGKKPPKILLHIFSNGGTNTATQLLIVLHKDIKLPVPLVGMILDSGPQKGHYWKAYKAMVLSLPNSPAWRVLGPVACHGLLIYLFTWIAGGNENPMSLQRRTLLDETKIAEDADMSGGLRRVCFLYGRDDPICDWRDVSEHADEAMRKGWLVKEVVFEGSGHCAHLSKDETRYVETVKGMWEGTTSWYSKEMSAKL